MINTNCETCVFSKISNEECLFDIPNSIRHLKKIYKKNESNYIENYKCHYTLSETIYKELIEQNHTHEEIIEYIISKLKIKYYLVIHIEGNKNNISELCSLINNLDVKPQFISFINKNLVDGNEISKIIQKNISDSIKWKLHNFIMDMDKQQCMTICMDTNFHRTGAHLFLVYDQSLNGNNYDLLNDRIKFLHMAMIVEQNPCHAVIDSFDKLDGLAMSFAAYKLLINSRSRDIMVAIKKENEEIPAFKYIFYDSNTR